MYHVLPVSSAGAAPTARGPAAHAKPVERGARCVRRIQAACSAQAAPSPMHRPPLDKEPVEILPLQARAHLAHGVHEVPEHLRVHCSGGAPGVRVHSAPGVPLHAVQEHADKPLVVAAQLLEVHLSIACEVDECGGEHEQAAREQPGDGTMHA
ncbi:hypothetical protein B0H17DRAFT_1149437 [Mycena rosella]|uniref:Uncharacterized protein n=1 Tax=Mycena rosella TaxID=1033263 RepID=A0AAD7C304_MYCRO|nr:hypothetical protein B0H17DRAFT_1149437 [Mycena rosella]